MSKRARLGLESLADRITPSATHIFAVGQDVGGTSQVRVYAEDGTPELTLTPFGPAFTGGARVATGDVTGDGIDDLVVAAGPGGGPEVKVFDGATWGLVRDFFAYDPSFRGGVNLAVGDTTGDGRADIVTGTGVGGGPNVRVFDGASGGQIASFFAYESSFRGGVIVAAGDVTGDGRADVVTGTWVGGGPRVQVFDGATGAQVRDFFAYDPSVRGGVTVAAGDVTGDGHADVVTGVGPGGGPNVRVFDGATGGLDESYFAYDPGFLGGVAVDVVTFNGAADVLVAPGPSAGGYINLFGGGNGTEVRLIQPFPSFQGGVTTGQGVATPAAPFSSVFAVPVVSLPPATGGAANGDTSGYGAPVSDGGGSGDFSNGGYTPPPYDPGSTYTPDPTPYSPDPGSTYTPDPGYSDSGYTDPGYSDTGSDCGCGGYTDPGVSEDW